MSTATTTETFPYNGSAGGVFAEWKKESRSFSDLALWGYAGYDLSARGGQLPENIRAATFSWNMLRTLGVEAALGRNFTADDDLPSANGTVILELGTVEAAFWGRSFDPESDDSAECQAVYRYRHYAGVVCFSRPDAAVVDSAQLHRARLTTWRRWIGTSLSRSATSNRA